jgi:hypothetical protein
MPQATTIVLTDGDSTDHSFTPEGRDANNVMLFKASNGVPIGDEKLSIGKSVTAQKRSKVSIRLASPVLATGAGDDGVARQVMTRVAYCDITFSFDGLSTTDERKNMRLMVSDLLGTGQTVSESIIDNLDSLY